MSHWPPSQPRCSYPVPASTRPYPREDESNTQAPPRPTIDKNARTLPFGLHAYPLHRSRQQPATSYASTPSTLLKNSLTLPISTSSPFSLSTATTKPPTIASTAPSSTPVQIATTRLNLSSSSELLALSALACSPNAELLCLYAAARALRMRAGAREVT